MVNAEKVENFKILLKPITLLSSVRPKYMVHYDSTGADDLNDIVVFCRISCTIT